MSITDPMMKAKAASTKCSSRISAAATRFSTNPVSEMALGVSRDSISRSRAVARSSPRQPLRARGARGRPGRSVHLLVHAVTLASRVRQAHASGRARAKASEAATAETAATIAPRAASIQKWLAVTTTTKVTTSG